MRSERRRGVSRPASGVQRREPPSRAGARCEGIPCAASAGAGFRGLRAECSDASRRAARERGAKEYHEQPGQARGFEACERSAATRAAEPRRSEARRNTMTEQLERNKRTAAAFYDLL